MKEVTELSCPRCAEEHTALFPSKLDAEIGETLFYGFCFVCAHATKAAKTLDLAKKNWTHQVEEGPHEELIVALQSIENLEAMTWQEVRAALPFPIHEYYLDDAMFEIQIARGDHIK